MLNRLPNTGIMFVIMEYSLIHAAKSNRGGTLFNSSQIICACGQPVRPISGQRMIFPSLKSQTEPRSYLYHAKTTKLIITCK